jgi:hypothetical protein
MNEQKEGVMIVRECIQMQNDSKIEKKKKKRQRRRRRRSNTKTKIRFSIVHILR